MRLFNSYLCRNLELWCLFCLEIIVFNWEQSFHFSSDVWNDTWLLGYPKIFFIYSTISPILVEDMPNRVPNLLWFFSLLKVLFYTNFILLFISVAILFRFFGFSRINKGGEPPTASLEQEKRIRREIANSNERRRMQSINNGFQSLRSLLPHHEGEKMSKVSIWLNFMILNLLSSINPWITIFLILFWGEHAKPPFCL